MFVSFQRKKCFYKASHLNPFNVNILIVWKLRLIKMKSVKQYTYGYFSSILHCYYVLKKLRFKNKYVYYFTIER